MNYRKRFALFALALAVLGSSACRITQKQGGQEQHQGPTDPGSGPGGTTTVVKALSMTASANAVCAGATIVWSVTITDPTSTNATGTASANEDVHVIVNTSMNKNELSVSTSTRKAGSAKLTYKQDGKTAEHTVQVNTCTVTPPTLPGPSGVEITPVGPQIFLVTQKEFFYCKGLGGSGVDQRCTWSKPSGAPFDIVADHGLVTATGYYKVEVECKTEGTALLKATSVADPTKFATLPLTCKGLTGTRNGWYILVTPNGWTGSSGQTMQFTATLHGAPPGTPFNPVWRCEDPNIAICVGTDTNSHPQLGTGSFKAGFTKLTNIKGEQKGCFQISRTDDGVYTCVVIRNQ